MNTTRSARRRERTLISPVVWKKKRTGPEQRKSPRRAVRYPARIGADDGSQLQSCVLSDISQTGAKLLTEGTNRIPGEFVLVLGGATRKCRIVWRSDDHVGVQFLAGAGNAVQTLREQ